jgi:hypothetical protein
MAVTLLAKTTLGPFGRNKVADIFFASKSNIAAAIHCE